VLVGSGVSVGVVVGGKAVLVAVLVGVALGDKGVSVGV
jgi:hypothetical protein